MLPGMDMLACPNLAVSPDIMRHVIEVESGANPYAIGVVGGRLVRQPRSLAEALATARMLDAKGYNFSLGLTQINKKNLPKYGIDSYESAFERCTNLSAGARILANCYKSAAGHWGKSFSCYYSGNFTTGYRHGYVQKIMRSIANAHGQQLHSPPKGADLSTAALQSGAQQKQPTQKTAAAASRIAMRSNPSPSMGTSASSAPGATPAPASPPTTLPMPAAAGNDVFVPQVRGPHDPPPGKPPDTPVPYGTTVNDRAFVF